MINLGTKFLLNVSGLSGQATIKPMVFIYSESISNSIRIHSETKKENHKEVLQVKLFDLIL